MDGWQGLSCRQLRGGLLKETEVGEDNERDEGQNRFGSKLDDDRNEEESLSTVDAVNDITLKQKKMKVKLQNKAKGSSKRIKC